MPRLPPVIISLCVVTLLACAPNRHFTRVQGDDTYQHLYRLDYFPSPPKYSTNPPDWKCIRYYCDCFGSSPIGAEIDWRSSNEASIEFFRISSYDYVDALTSIYDESNPTARTFNRTFKVLHYSLTTNYPAIIDALTLAWEHLSKFTYYNHFSVDGCGYHVETYDPNGLRRRCSVSSPEQPQFGQDVIRLLALVLDYAQKKAMNWHTYDEFHGYALDENGIIIPRDTNDILCDIQNALAQAVANEPQVQRYYFSKPCDEEASKRAKTIDVAFEALEGCFTVKQAVDKKQWATTR